MLPSFLLCYASRRAAYVYYMECVQITRHALRCDVHATLPIFIDAMPDITALTPLRHDAIAKRQRDVAITPLMFDFRGYVTPCYFDVTTPPPVRCYATTAAQYGRRQYSSS